MGKSRASRNALKHGLRARLVVPEEDETAFRGMAARLFAEIGPWASWRASWWPTSRLRCGAPAAPGAWRPKRWPATSPTRSSWNWPCATRAAPRASCSGCCGRCRACAAGRWRPQATPAPEHEPTAPSAVAAEADRPDTTRPEIDSPDERLPAVAELAWGGGAAALPPPPPGCLMLRPVRLRMAAQVARGAGARLPRRGARTRRRATAMSMRWRTGAGCSAPGRSPRHRQGCRSQRHDRTNPAKLVDAQAEAVGATARRSAADAAPRAELGRGSAGRGRGPAQGRPASGRGAVDRRGQLRAGVGAGAAAQVGSVRSRRLTRLVSMASQIRPRY